ncbi:MAG TPA: LURP-one-related family protein [Gemmatimonadaceae bacterium]|nr:LURP-one-related family protein [Gemmatimonadaceae bacterium]
MRYVMRQKLLSLADNFTIKNEQEQDVFLVKGKLFSFGDKLSFQDLAGNELVYIDQRLLNWSPTYELWKQEELLAVVKRELFSFIHHRFTVDVPGPNDLEAEGDFLDHEYTITRGGSVMATVSKRWFSWTDTYGIEIADGEDDVLVLATAVVVDMVCHDDNKRR